ncbi:MAG TPA: hotdog fold domain-containing protein [Longimicrobium sp.]|nr:hotdog fold domain-containing protein [Longimicrobium sp.]
MSTTAPRTPEGEIRRQWDRLSGRPGGKALFSFLLGRMVPYTGSMGARVEEMGPGHARVTLRDRRRVRNHLRSVHAVALMNLAELTTGLAFIYAMPADARSILRALTIEYHKKARGRLTAEAAAPLLESSEEREIEVRADIRDEAGDVVATGVARWLVGPRR